MTERTANVYIGSILAGKLSESKDGFAFRYLRDYLERPDATAVSLTLPLSERPYQSKNFFPFFKGLIPEGWLFDLNARALKIDPHDEFGMLLHTGRDCIGAVTVIDEMVAP